MSDQDPHVLEGLDLVAVSLVEEPVNPACTVGSVEVQGSE